MCHKFLNYMMYMQDFWKNETLDMKLLRSLCGIHNVQKRCTMLQMLDNAPKQLSQMWGHIKVFLHSLIRDKKFLSEVCQSIKSFILLKCENQHTALNYSTYFLSCYTYFYYFRLHGKEPEFRHLTSANYFLDLNIPVANHYHHTICHEHMPPRSTKCKPVKSI